MWPSLYKLTNVSCFIASSLYIIGIHINSERWRFLELDLNRLKTRPRGSFSEKPNEREYRNFHLQRKGQS